MPGAVYFVSFVAAARAPWLQSGGAATSLLDSLRHWHAEGEGAILAATVMPDHVHVLFKLGHRLDVGRCVSRWKSTTLRKSGYCGKWQRDFWEHRLRANESWEDYGLYVFLNPYRAGLLTPSESWHGLWMPQPELFRFTAFLGPMGEPPREWMDLPDDRFAGLAIGE